MLWILISAIAAAGTGNPKSREVQVGRPHRWVGELHVCPKKGVDKDEFDYAVLVWSLLGHRVERGCGPSSIEVEKAPFLEDRGVSLLIGEGKKIVHAKILVREDSAMVIAHEIGHVLGYEHTKPWAVGHLMHGWLPGWEATDLRAKWGL